jgi:carbonic anhydrase/acetyltransferase-like protein (isoleucine patch superfamily)
MPIYQLGQNSPIIHETAWIAPTAVIIGSVEIGEGSSVWFNAVLRGDQASIVIGKHTNIQDGCVIHSNVHVGDRCTVGHGAVLHGCHIEDGALIGMKATVLDRVRLGPDCLIGAGSVVTKSHEGGSLLLGVPAVVKRQLSQEEIDNNRIQRANRYTSMSDYYRHSLEEVDYDCSYLNEIQHANRYTSMNGYYHHSLEEVDHNCSCLNDKLMIEAARRELLQ